MRTVARLCTAAGLLKNDHGKARGPTAKSGLCTRYWTDVLGISARGSPWDPTDEQLSRVALRYLYVAHEGALPRTRQ